MRGTFRLDLREGLFVLWPVGHDDFARAGEFLGDAALGLRTLDGLHLAIAAGRGEELITADRRLVAAAGILKLPVQRVD
ncbi:MAG: PIN domain-containing protein [Terriglobales bacterium]